MVGKLIRGGDRNIKADFEGLLRGEHLRTTIDEQIVYNQLDGSASAIWSLLLASGYLKVISYESYEEFDETGDCREPEYELALTNLEVRLMFRKMVGGWFAEAGADYNDFIKALLQGNVKAMNTYMNRVALTTFSYFDTGKKPSASAEPERFYHGFVLGLMVELSDRYAVLSNRESGFGRYDVLLEPKKAGEDGIILEFKVHEPDEEETLADTVQAALAQIEEKQYAASLEEKGVRSIRKYGFAFEGKRILIG